MLLIVPDFTTLERAVLAAICEVYSEDRAALEAQLSTATLLSRENTGDPAASSEAKGAAVQAGR